MFFKLSFSIAASPQAAACDEEFRLLGLAAAAAEGLWRELPAEIRQVELGEAWGLACIFW